MDTKHARGFWPVAIALLGNAFVMTLKWIAFFVSGSGSMFSEAVHSIADVFNQVLLMVGIRRSRKPSSIEHPYGYGGERFFWAVISACSIFFIGAGVTIYRGINTLFSEQSIHIEPIVFWILFVSFIVESITFFIAFRELRHTNPNDDLLDMLENGDPSTIAVLLEDGIALLGIIFAFIGIFLSYITGQPYWDALGSIVIGVLLGVMALVLINKNRMFLIHKSIPEETRDKIIEVLQSDPAIEKVLDFKSGILDVGVYHIKCEVEFNGSALMYLMYRKYALRDEFDDVRDDYNEFVRFCVNYADRVPRVIGSRIDEMEQRIRQEIPEVRHIDIEVN